MMERRYVTIKEALSRLTQAELDSMITKVSQTTIKNEFRDLCRLVLPLPSTCILRH